MDSNRNLLSIFFLKKKIIIIFLFSVRFVIFTYVTQLGLMLSIANKKYFNLFSYEGRFVYIKLFKKRFY